MTSTCVTRALNKHRSAIGDAEITALEKDANALKGKTEALRFVSRAEANIKHYNKERADVVAALRDALPQYKEAATETPPAAQATAKKQTPRSDAERLALIDERLSELEARLNDDFATPLSDKQSERTKAAIENLQRDRDAIERRQARLQQTGGAEAVAEEAVAEEAVAEEDVAALGRGDLRDMEGVITIPSNPYSFDYTGDAVISSPGITGLLRQGTTADGLLTHIINSKATPGFAKVVARLLRAMDVQATIKYDPQAARSGGNYTNGVVTIYRNGENVHTVLHELLHAATVAKLNRAVEISAMSEAEQKALSKEDKALYYAYQKLGRLSEEVQAKFGSDQYGFKNVFEFVAEALSNSDLQYMMVNTPSAEKAEAPSLWRTFMDWLKRLLGVEETGSVMERFLEVAPQFLSSKAGRGVHDIGTLPTDAIEYSEAYKLEGGENATFRAHAAAQRAHEKRTFAERARHMKEGVSEFIRKLQTQRGYAAGSFGGSTLTYVITNMGHLKQRIMSEWNASLAPYVLADEESKKRVSQALAMTSEFFMNADTSAMIQKYVHGTEAFYTSAPYDGRLIIEEDLAATGKLTLEQFRNGVVLPNRHPTKKWALSKMTEKDYAAYLAAKGTMDNAQAQVVASEIRRIQKAQEVDVNVVLRHIVAKAGKDEAAIKKGEELVNTLINMATRFDAVYTQRLVTDSDGRTALPRNYDADFATFRLDLYSLFAGQATTGALQRVADWTGTPIADLEAGMPRWQTNDKKVLDMVKAFFVNRAALDDSVTAKKITAIESIVRGYVPMRRRGRFVIPMRYVTADGEPFDPDAVDVQVGKDSANTVKASGFLPLYTSDNYTELVNIQKELADSLKDLTFTYTYKDADGKEATKELRMVADTVVEKDVGNTLLNKYDYTQIMDALQRVGVSLSMPQREQLIKASTGAESRYRSMLKREGKLGYSEDFSHILPEMLTSLASMLSIREFTPRIQTVIADPDGKYWGALDLAPYQADYDAAVAAGNKANIAIAKKKLDTAKRFHATGTSLRSQTVRAHFQKWANWVLDTGAEETKDITTTLRAGTTIAQLGGTFASAVINLPSLALHTLNALATYNAKTGFGGGFGYQNSFNAITKAAGTLKGDVLGASFKHFLTGEVSNVEAILREYVEKAQATGTYKGYSKEAWSFILREVESGALQAQKHNETMSLASGNPLSSKFGPYTARWMAMFSGTEEFNRMTTALAAYELYEQQAKAAGKNVTSLEVQEELDALAIQMVYDTQGEYTMANRPELFRNGVMSLLFLYKTFAIITLELINNMPPQGRAVFLGSLMGMSGLRGLPFYDELTALIDFFVQKTGVGRTLTRGNIDSAFDSMLREVGLNRVMLNGVLDTMLGTEIFGRAGVKVGIPGVGLLRDGSSFFEEVGRTLGAPGGALEATVKAGGALSRGDLLGALRVGPVTGVKNLADAYTYASYDNVMNKRGQVVLHNPDAIDVMARALGFYPEEFIQVNQQYGNERMVSLHAKALHNSLTEEFRKLYVLKDSAGMADLRREIVQFNKDYAGTGLEFNNYATRLERAGKEAAMELRERAVKTLPKSQQARAREAMAEY